MTCEHKFTYAGIKYELTNNRYPGSGAREVQYFDFFFCEKCLEKKYVKLDCVTTSYDKIQFGAAPK